MIQIIIKKYGNETKNGRWKTWFDGKAVAERLHIEKIELTKKKRRFRLLELF